MTRTLLKSKIHRATVTGSDLHYVGSITLDAELMQAADLLPGELVHVLDVDNGARFETYVIEGPPGSGEVCLNGAAAHRIKPHDVVIVCSYVQLDDAECRGWRATRVFVDAANRIREIA